MQVDVVMPQMGESVAEGTIVKWHKQVGDKVEKDETILEISTDKVDSEIPAPTAGVITKLSAKEGDTVEVGSVIAVIETDAEKGMEVERTEPKEQPEPELQPAPQKEAEKEEEPEKKRVLSPLVRSIAEKENIPRSILEDLPGSGWGGRLRKEDVLFYLQQKSKEDVKVPEKEKVESAAAKIEQPLVEEPKKPEYTFTGNIERVPMNHVRKSIAKNMLMSVKTSPHVTSVHEVDVTGIMEFIRANQPQFVEREGIKLTLTAFIAQVTAKALKEFPAVNASVDGEEIIYHKDINIGIAVAMENGLIVPVVRHVDELNLVGIAKAIYDVAIRARNKKLSPDEVQGGTFSITNYGVFDTLIGTPIINQPQVAILGTGAAKQQPVVIDNMLAIRWRMYLSLTFDHRLLDGAAGGRFLQRITELLENYNLESLT